MIFTDYKPKTDYYPHQRAELEDHWRVRKRAIWWVPRAGKSKLTLDTAAMLFLDGKIDGLFVVAPNGVHEQWVDVQVPQHLPDEVPRQAVAYGVQAVERKWHQQEIRELLGFQGLAVLTMSYDGFCTKKGNKVARAFLKRRTCLYVLDESHRIKTPGTSRSRRVLKTPRFAPYRRILTGTPVTKGPFDVYAQMRFLDPSIWAGYGWRKFSAFKATFGIFERGFNGKTGKEYDALSGYQHVGRLRKIIRPFVSRVTEEELDLPDRVYTTYRFDLSPEQRRAYDELKEKCRVELEDQEEVSATQVIVRILRLQQITCGYVPTERGTLEDLFRVRKSVHYFKQNPRRDLFRELIQDRDHPFIAWSSYLMDVDVTAGVLAGFKDPVPHVTHDGRTSKVDRKEARSAFLEGRTRAFLGTAATAGEGLDLRPALTVFYYSNSYKYGDRYQSERRALAVGKKSPVEYVDLVARDTVDEQIRRNLQQKRNLADQLTGDAWKPWFE